jgi:hypothetical protein
MTVGQSGSEAGTIETIKDKAQDFASSVMSTAEEAWGTTREMAGNVATSVASTAEDAWDSMISCMRRYPLSSFAAGMALGVLVTLAMQSSTRRSWSS